MIFELYSGSDKTETVPQKITQFFFYDEDTKPEVSIEQLLECLKIEEDRNWRGYLKHYLGLKYFEVNEDSLGEETLNEGLEVFDQFASNFRDVEVQYALTLIELAKRESDIDARLEYALRTIPYHRQIEEYSTTACFAESLWKVADVLYDKAVSSDEEFYYSLTLEFYLKIHRIWPENMYALECIAYAYYGLNEPEEVKRIFATWERLGDGIGFKYSNAPKFREWVYSVFPEALQECISAGVDGPGRN